MITTILDAHDTLATLEMNGRHACLSLSGTADREASDPIADCLKELHSTRFEEIVIDFRALEFMSAACFKTFVNWLSDIVESDPHLRIRLRANAAKPWQRRSVGALACFASEMVSVEMGGEP